MLLEPRKALKFSITPKNVKCAKKGDAEACVIAQALKHKFHRELTEVRVCKSITKLYFRALDRIERYQTPPELSKALPRFDRTGQWNLPDGVYELKPIAPSQKLARKNENQRRRRQEKKLEEATGIKRVRDRSIEAKPRKRHKNASRQRLIALARRKKASTKVINKAKKTRGW